MMVPYLIAIAGGSGSGKSWLADHLAEHLPAILLPLDSYYRDLSQLELAARAHQNFDVPEALDWSLIEQHVGDLAKGFEVDKPVYDFATHTRLAAVERIRPGEFVLLEGFFALYQEKVRSLCGARVFLWVEDPICLARRMERDMRHRGRTRESVIAQYNGTVRPMYERYVLPTRAFADLVLYGEDPVEKLAAAVYAHIEQGGGSVVRPRRLSM